MDLGDARTWAYTLHFHGSQGIGECIKVLTTKPVVGSVDRLEISVESLEDASFTSVYDSSGSRHMWWSLSVQNEKDPIPPSVKDPLPRNGSICLFVTKPMGDFGEVKGFHRMYFKVSSKHSIGITTEITNIT